MKTVPYQIRRTSTKGPRVLKRLAFIMIFVWLIHLVVCLFIAPTENGEWGKREGSHYYLYSGRSGYREVSHSVYVRARYVKLSGFIGTPLGLLAWWYYHREEKKEAELELMSSNQS
jgi:hypothetical protein